MVEHDDELRIYYCGKINGHSLRHSKMTETIVEGRNVKGGIGLATLRRDGFVSVNVGETGGELMTRLFKPGS